MRASVKEKLDQFYRRERIRKRAPIVILFAFFVVVASLMVPVSSQELYGHIGGTPSTKGTSIISIIPTRWRIRHPSLYNPKVTHLCPTSLESGGFVEADCDLQRTEILRGQRVKVLYHKRLIPGTSTYYVIGHVDA